MSFSIFLLIFLLNFFTAETIDVFVNTTVPKFVVSDKYIGVTMTPDLRYYSADWHGINLTTWVPLYSALGPSHLRFGGTRCDKLVFHANGNESELYIFTGTDLDKLYGFTQAAGYRLIFCLNLGTMFKNSTWNDTNARELIEYANSKGYSIDFELGNEPDLFHSEFGTYPSGKDIAHAFNDLRAILNNYTLFQNATLMGPSVSYADYLVTDFLNGGLLNGTLNAVTFHHYYFDGSHSGLGDYLSPGTMNNVYPDIDYMLKETFRPIWLAETGTDWCICAFNLTTTYADGFLYLDKLGVTAASGIEVFIRENHASLALVNDGELTYTNVTAYPNADYWVTFLHKKLVGTQVFELTRNENDTKFRVYASSNKNSAGFVLFGVNVANYSFNLNLTQLTNPQVTAYILKEGDAGNLQSKKNRLNGELLDWAPHQTVANIKGNVTTLPVYIPPHSQFFVVAGQNDVNQCPQGWTADSAGTNKCFKLITNYTPPWFAANFDCTTYSTNASLVSIDNAFENTQIASLTASNTPCTQFYIGLYKNGADWTWSNGDTGTYRNWKSGMPSSDPNRNCVSFDAKTGSWSNVDCDGSTCYICQQYFK